MKAKRSILMTLLIGITCVCLVGCSTEKEVKEDPVEVQTPEPTQQPVVTETLPVGSIVTLQGDTQKYMIIKHEHIVKELPDLVFEYAACVYPIGNVSLEPAMSFNNEDIESVVFEGLTSVEGVNIEPYEMADGGENYVPLGTLIHVEGMEMPLMIIGRFQQLSGETQVYDYAACEYPSGYTDPNGVYVLNNEDISGTYKIGYSDEAEEKFIEEFSK